MGKGNSNKAPMPPQMGQWVVELSTGKTVVLNIVGAFDDAMIYEKEENVYGHVMNAHVVLMHPMKAKKEEEKKESE